MVVHISNYPLASPIISLSIATEIVDDQITKVVIDLASRIELLPNAVMYFTNNNLLPEALSKAGLKESTQYSQIQQTSYVVVGTYHYYKLQLTISAS